MYFSLHVQLTGFSTVCIDRVFSELCFVSIAFVLAITSWKIHEQIIEGGMSTEGQRNKIIIISSSSSSITAIEFSLGGSSPFTSTDKTNNIHKRNNTKIQYKQYKTQ